MNSPSTPPNGAEQTSAAYVPCIGDHVRHYMSGWTGIVASISTEEACGQGRLVTVDPVYAGGMTWKAITVTEAELEPEGLTS